MARFRGVLLALVAAATPGRTFAYDHLVPEDSALARMIPNIYRCCDRAYLNSLAPVFDQSVRIFVVTDGSPFPESVIGLKRVDGRYYIFGAQPSGPTSYATLPPLPPPPPLKLMGTDGKLHAEPALKPVARKPLSYVLKTCRHDIDGAMADRVVRVWDSVLLQTRPEAGKPGLVSDGAISHFGSNMTYSVVTGVAVDAPRDSRPGWLGIASFDLAALCWDWNLKDIKGATEPKVELEQAVRHLEENK